MKDEGNCTILNLFQLQMQFSLVAIFHNWHLHIFNEGMRVGGKLKVTEMDKLNLWEGKRREIKWLQSKENVD